MRQRALRGFGSDMDLRASARLMLQGTNFVSSETLE
jgi:hypothetical protein